MPDIRPLEVVLSVMMVLMVPALVGMPAVMWIAMGSLASDGAGGVLGAFASGLCCLVASAVFGGLPLLWLFKDSRTGRAGPIVQGAAEQLGGEASVGRLYLPMLSPRLSGTLDGRPYRIDLRRQAGVLSPRTPGRRLLFGWYLFAHVGAKLPGKVGFAPSGTATFGAGLLGLSGPEEAHGLRVWTGGTDAGRAITHDEAVGQAASTIVAFPSAPGLIVRVGPSEAVFSAMLKEDLTADALASLVRDLATLAEACEQAAARAG